MRNFEFLADGLLKVQNSDTADRSWTAYSTCAGEVGVTRIVAVNGGNSPTFHLDQVLYSSVPATALAQFDSSAVGGGSPLRRMAMRSPDPFLVSSVMSSLARPNAEQWLQQFRQWLEDEDLFVVPARREESLVGVAALAGPNDLFDSLNCSVLTVISHAALFRSEELGAKPGRRERATLTERERACLRLAATGLNAHGIATELKISDRTARFHLDNARMKLGVATRSLAVRKAIRLGLVKPLERG